MQSRRPHVHFAQGLLMGTADVIPGVSGGTVALIVGIYEALVASIEALGAGVARALRGDGAGARRRLSEVQWRLLLPLLAGIVCALAVGSLVIPFLLERYPPQMRAVFFGLIAGSLAVPWKRIKQPGARAVTLAVLAAVVAFVLVGLPAREPADPTLLQVFGSAAIAICAMILPGVSGAFLLLVLGVYEPTLAAVRNLNIAYVGVFVVGAAVGLAVFSQLLRYLLERHHDLTMAGLVGLMAGSLRALWPWLDEDRGLLAPPADAGMVLTVIALAVVAFATVTALTGFGERGPRELTPDTEAAASTRG